ncbi:MAG: AbrB/MazE/SpoVT family DNA-binding domain-containing protein [Acidobacteriota bacterium]|nr:AbrB/MazE/SpoVT family DNA-binding domain-containing protein [Acidobacteriota bacterium]
MEITRLSTKGQIILPRIIRDAKAWRPGTEFTVEETKDGILLRAAKSFPATEIDQVAGCLSSRQKAKMPAQMNAAVRRKVVLREVTRRHDSGRY